MKYNNEYLTQAKNNPRAKRALTTPRILYTFTPLNSSQYVVEAIVRKKQLQNLFIGTKAAHHNPKAINF